MVLNEIKVEFMSKLIKLSKFAINLHKGEHNITLFICNKFREIRIKLHFQASL